MAHPFLAGENVYLRPVEPRDLDGPWTGWLNDFEVTRFLETGVFPTTRESLERYVETVVGNPQNVMLAIVDRKSDTHIGNIKLGPIQWIHRRADMGILIGDKEFWGRGFGREAVALITDYGFRRLNLHKITLGVYADNEPAVRMYQKLGFRIEGTLKEHLFSDGRYHDKHVMGILSAEWSGPPRGAAGP